MDPPGRGGGGLVAGPEVAGRLERWLAESRADASARARAREQWLQRAAEEDASLAGVLADLCERGDPVAVVLRSGRRHQGTVRAVGSDFCLLASASGEIAVALGQLAAIRPVPGTRPSTGGRGAPSGYGLAEILGALAAERERVLLVTAGTAEAVSGELRWAGQDVVAVRTDGDPPGSVYVPIAAVAEIVV